MNTRSSASLALACALAAFAAAGCTRVNARATPDAPPLDVPPPPPRVVEAADPETLQPGTLVEEPARNTPRTRPEPAVRSDASRPDTAPADAAGDAAPPSGEPKTAPPSPSLQTRPPEQERNFEREIRVLLEQAKTTLGKVDYNRLSPGARSQYNQARQFAQGAEDALRDRNLVYAQNLADKAATLAAQLARR